MAKCIEKCSTPGPRSLAGADCQVFLVEIAALKVAELIRARGKFGSAHQFEPRLRDVRSSAVNHLVHDLPAGLEVPRLGSVVDEIEVHVKQDRDATNCLGTLVEIGGLVVRVSTF